MWKSFAKCPGYFYTGYASSAKKDYGMGITALVFGILGLFAWFIPIIGLPIGIVALILGILGIKNSSKGISIAGIVLAIICLVLTIINGAIGAYQGYHGEAWFQKNNIMYEYNSDNETISNLSVMAAISEGACQTTGLDSYEDTEKMAESLRSTK